MGGINIDVSEMRKFFESMEKLGGDDFKKELELFLEGIGNEFLRIVQDVIKNRYVINSRQLLASFTKDTKDNVWRLEEGNLTLEIGSALNYAAYVNDGHWTNPKGVSQRFVPGDVELGTDGKIIKFTYNPSAKTGMMLKQKWVKGTHYWEAAIRILEKMLPDIMEAKMQQFLSKYF